MAENGYRNESVSDVNRMVCDMMLCGYWSVSVSKMGNDMWNGNENGRRNDVVNGNIGMI